MRRLVSIFALACVLVQIPLPFFEAKKAEAATYPMLRNIIPSNIEYSQDQTNALSKVVKPQEIPYRWPVSTPNFYQANPEGKAGSGSLKIEQGKGCNQTACVLRVTVDLSNINAAAFQPFVDRNGDGMATGVNEIGDFTGMIDSDMEKDSLEGLFILVGTEVKEKEELYLHGTLDWLLGGTIPDIIKTAEELKNAGFPWTKPHKTLFVNGEVDFSIPQDKDSATKYGNATDPSEVEALNGYNIGYYLLKRKDASIGNVAPIFVKSDGGQFSQKISFNVPIKFSKDDAGKTYHVQVVADEDDGNEDSAYSLPIQITLNKDENQNPALPDGKNIDEYIDGATGELSEYVENETADRVIGQMLSCKWTNPVSWFTDCMVMAFNNIIYRPSAFILEISAKVMDMFIGFSVSNFFYGDTITFIEEGWRIVRDVSNILFIFILLWTAFNIILRVNHHFNANRVITQLIIIGLLINFSLFFTRVIIDAGNIGARVFYNAITTVGDDDFKQIKSADGNNGVSVKSLSGGIAEGMQITRILTPGIAGKILAGGGGAGMVFLLLLIGVIMNVIAAWIFFQSAFFFIGRIITLWAAMIFSPFALTSTILPQLSQVPKIGWGVWLKNLLSAAFGAMFFLFFIFLILKFINSKFLQGIAENYDSISGGTVLAVVLLQFLFIIGLIKAAKSIASIMAGEFGGALAAGLEGATKFLGGAAVGLGAGALAFGGSRLLGGRASSWLNSAEGNMHKQASTGSQSGLNALRNSNLAKYGNMTDQQLRDLAQKKVEGKQKMASRSFDIRNTGAANLITKGTGIDFNAAAALGKLTGIGMLKATDIDITSGGFQASIDRKAQKQKTYLDSLHLNDEEKKKLEEELKEKEEELKEAKKPHEGQIESNERLAKQLLERIQARGDKATAAEEAQLKAYQDLTNAAKDSLSKNHVNADPTIKALASRIEEIKKGTVNPATGAREGGLEQVGKSAMRMYQDFLTRNHMAHQREGYLGRAGGEWRNNRNIFYQRSLGRAFLQLGKNIPNAIVDAFKTGIVGSAVFGPGTGLGLAIGKSVDQALFGGGFLKAFKSFTTDELGGARRVEQQALHALEAGHVHEPHAKVIYKSPNQGIFDMFKSSSGGGGGGAKKDSHGHGGGHH